MDIGRAKSHSQKAPAGTSTCSKCRNMRCDKCIDITRAMLHRNGRICACGLRDHDDIVSGHGVVSTYTGDEQLDEFAQRPGEPPTAYRDRLRRMTRSMKETSNG